MDLTVNIVRDELLEQCKQGHKPSYQLLYQRYSKAMYNTSLRIVNNRTDAEDVLQEAFLDAFRSLNDFNYHSTFGAWLKKIVINKSITVLRKRKGFLLSLDESTAAAIPAEESIDEKEISFKVSAVKKAIEKLPDGYRTVLSLYLLEGYDQEEISEIIGITHNTVRSQYMRAKQKLLHLLKEEGFYEQKNW
ncbi:MAG: RNA polymerase sigma factor [Chitinophagaceae bacterium]